MNDSNKRKNAFVEMVKTITKTSGTLKDRPIDLPGTVAVNPVHRVYQQASLVHHEFEGGYGTGFANYTCAGDHADDAAGK